MARVKTYGNGIAFLPSELNTIEDDYEKAFSTYKTVGDMEGAWRFDAAAGGTYLLSRQTGSGAPLAASGALAGLSVVYLDPADWAVGAPNARTTKLRVRTTVLVNATAPAVNFTVGLYPVSAVAGAAATVSITLGAVTAGSTVAHNTPGASSLNQSNSGDFTAPAAGHYALAVVVSGAMAANSAVVVGSRLQMRQV